MINITFSKGSENFIFSICDSMFKRTCFFCGKKITKKNIGGAFHKGYFCSNICCLIEYYEKYGKEVKDKKNNFPPMWPKNYGLLMTIIISLFIIVFTVCGLLIVLE